MNAFFVVIVCVLRAICDATVDYYIRVYIMHVLHSRHRLLSLAMTSHMNGFQNGLISVLLSVCVCVCVYCEFKPISVTRS